MQPIRGTRLIAVSFDDHNPNRAAVLANTLIESYKNQYLQSHYSATSEASDWLTKQLEDLKQNVEQSEKKLTDFEKETGILTFDMVASAPEKGGDGGTGQAHSVVIQKLDALNAELTQAEANRIEKEAIYRFTKSGNPDTILAIGNDPIASSTNSAVLSQSGGLSALGSLRQQQGSLKVALADASGKYGANNRHLKDLQTQMQEVNRQIDEEIGRVANRAQVDYQLAKQAEDSVRDRFKQQQEEANKLNGKAVELAVLSQEAASRKRLYEDLYTKLQEANISAGIKATNITVVDPAWAHAKPRSSEPEDERDVWNVFRADLRGDWRRSGWRAWTARLQLRTKWKKSRDARWWERFRYSRRTKSRRLRVCSNRRAYNLLRRGIRTSRGCFRGLSRRWRRRAARCELR